MHQKFLHHRICTFISACVVSLLSKTNVQIFVTQAIVMQKFLMQENHVAKINAQTFSWTYFCYKNFCVKNLWAKNLCVQIFCIFICERDYVIKSAKKYCLSERLPKQRCANDGVIDIQKFLHIYFCACFFCIYIFVYLIQMTI